MSHCRLLKTSSPVLRAVALAALLLAALPILSGTPVAQTGENTCGGNKVARVQRAYQKMASFSGRFEQEDRRTDGRIDKAQGSIAYRRPGRMRWEYEPPHEQLLVTDGKTVWLFDPLLDNVTIQPLEELTQGTPLSFLLGVGNLEDDFTCRGLSRPVPSDGLSYLELLPRKAIPGLAYIQIGVHRGSARLGVLRMVDGEGNIRQIRLRDLRTGVTFPAGHFIFQVTEDMEVISK